MVKSCEVTLLQMLQAREKRAGKQRALIDEYRHALISFTVNMPGPCKHSFASNRIFTEGLRELLKKLAEAGIIPVYQKMYRLYTGNEAFVVIEHDAVSIKKLVVELEEQHPLGCLFDFDILDAEGNTISRPDLFLPVRKCLLCDNGSHICARSRAHPTGELIDRINSMTDLYFRRG